MVSDGDSTETTEVLADKRFSTLLQRVPYEDGEFEGPHSQLWSVYLRGAQPDLRVGWGALGPRPRVSRAAPRRRGQVGWRLSLCIWT